MISLTVTTTIRSNRAAIPIACTIPSCSGLTGLRRTASIIRNKSLPPSSAGNGKRLKMPIFMVMNAPSDYVVSMARVREGASVLTVAENGLGRRVPLESYKVQNRGGYGLMNYKSGGVCGIKVVDDEDDIIMISTDGIVIRIRACDISMMSRYSRGVRLMRVGEDGRVVSFTRTEHDDDVETAEVEKATAEEIAEAQAEENAEVIEDNTESVENEDSENTEE